MAVVKISFTYGAVAITRIPWLEAFVAIIDETMSRQPFYNFAKFDLISSIIFINMLNCS